MSTPPDEQDLAYVWDMLEAAYSIRDFVQGATYDTFMADRMLHAAVQHQLLVLGEAARRISEDYKSRYPDIPWRGIIGQRNVVAHLYDVIDYREIWNVATQRLPDLVKQLEAMIPGEGKP